MPVSSFTIQPAANALRAAYRPIILKVEATATGGGARPPFVMCDIYIGGVYYKTVPRTAPDEITDTLSRYQFDVSEPLQEYLAADLAQLNNQGIARSSHSSAKVFCRFRSSDVDADGFTVEEPTKPIQGTKFTVPVAGTGFESNTFFVINAALQHEDNPELATHLNAYKQGTWAADAFPLSHRNKYFFCKNDSDHFPFIYRGECLEAELVLNYRNKGETEFTQATSTGGSTCEPLDYDLEVSGNTVNISLEAAPTLNVKVQIKLIADSVWTDKGTFTAQNFSFNVSEVGEYDIRIIHFCSSCDSGTPVADTFEIDTISTVAWRGINPFCEQQTFEDPIYIVLETRDPVTTNTYFPNEITPSNYTTLTKADLYAKFYSDAAHLSPLVVTQLGLKVYVKQRVSTVEDTGLAINSRVTEYLLPFTVDASDDEVLLGEVTTVQNIDYFGPYPTVTSESDNAHSYTPFPTHLLTGGNTGDKGYDTLEQYNTVTNVPTGTTKPNIDSDPDYIAPAADGTTCPAGPDKLNVLYGYGLEIAKVEIKHPTSTYAETNTNTDSGGYQLIYNIPRNVNINLTIKAKTLDGSNTTGILKVRVVHSTTGSVVTDTFNIPDNVETNIPATFQNITQINISNY